MKEPKEKFKSGDIVTQRRTGFRRMIRYAHIEPRGTNNKPTVCYSYFTESLDSNYRPTGEFNKLSFGFCSENHLISWISK